MKKWLTEQWRQIRGHIKFEIGKWLILKALGGATLIGLVVWFRQKLLHISPDWYLFAFVFVASLILFLYSDAKIKNSLASLTSPASSSETQSMAAAEEIPLDPHKARLRADVMDMLFHSERSSIGNDIFVLLQLRIVNHGEEEVVITEWKLEARVGKNSREFKQVDIPEDWRIRHLPSVGATGSARTPLVENPDRHLLDKPLRRGIPQTCWVNFKMQTLAQSRPPHNAEFVLTLDDTLGASHVAATWGPGFFRDTGDIIIEQGGA